MREKINVWVCPHCQRTKSTLLEMPEECRRGSIWVEALSMLYQNGRLLEARASSEPMKLS